MPSFHAIIKKSGGFNQISLGNPPTNEKEPSTRDIVWYLKLIQLVACILLTTLYKYCLYLSENGLIFGLLGALITYCALTITFSYSRKENKQHMVISNTIAKTALVYIGGVVGKDWYNVQSVNFNNDLPNGVEFLMLTIVIYTFFAFAVFLAETIILLCDSR